MKNKKADIQSPIKLILAMLLLVVLGSWIGITYGDTIIPKIKTIFPDFGIGGEIYETQILGYDIQWDIVEVFNENDWLIPNKDEKYIQFYDKIVPKAELLNAFQNHYYILRTKPDGKYQTIADFGEQYQSQLRNNLQTNKGILSAQDFPYKFNLENLGTPNWNYDPEFSIKNWWRGEEGKITIGYSINENEGEYKLTADNKLLFRTPSGDEIAIGKIDSYFQAIIVTNKSLTNTPMSNEIKAHLKKIRDEPIENIKITDLKSVKSKTQIKINEKYSLRKIKEERNLVKFKLFYEERPLNIFWTGKWEDIGFLEIWKNPEFSSELTILDISKDTWKEQKQYLFAPEKEMIEKAKAWKDGVIAIPIKIPYISQEEIERAEKTKEGKATVEYLYTCAKRIDKKLTIDLEKEVNEFDTCPIITIN